MRFDGDLIYFQNSRGRRICQLSHAYSNVESGQIVLASLRDGGHLLFVDHQSKNITQVQHEHESVFGFHVSPNRQYIAHTGFNCCDEAYAGYLSIVEFGGDFERIYTTPGRLRWFSVLWVSDHELLISEFSQDTSFPCSDVGGAGKIYMLNVEIHEERNIRDDICGSIWLTDTSDDNIRFNRHVRTVDDTILAEVCTMNLDGTGFLCMPLNGSR
ncbi:MAG: hypothetical protein AAF125_03385 [Chloroflexota bacterium]